MFFAGLHFIEWLVKLTVMLYFYKKKMFMRFRICCFLFCLFLFSCKSNIHRELDRIEQEMEQAPDSALAHLESIQTEQMKTKSCRARHALLTSMALDKNYIDVTDDSLINIAVNYYSESKWYPKYRMLALYYKGIVQKNSGNYPAAIYSFEQAANLAEDQENWRYLGLIYRNTGDVFNHTNNMIAAADYHNKAIDAFYMNNDSLYAQYAQYSFAVDLMNIKEYGRSREVFHKLMISADDNLKINCILCYAQTFVELEDSLEEALYIYRNTPLSNYQWLDYGYRSQAHLHLRQIDSAQYWIGQAFKLARSNEDRATLEFFQAEIDSVSHDHFMAYNHIRRAANVQDSLTRVLLTQSLSIAQRDYYRQEADIQNLRVRRQKALMAVWTVVGALIALLAFLFFKQKASQKEQALQNTIAKLEIEKYKSEKATSELVGTLFLEKYAHLGTLADSCFGNDGNETLDSFKKTLASLGNNTSAFTDLYKMLDSYADGVLQKFKKQLPALSKSNLKLISLFFAGIPDEITQYIMRRQSVGSLKTFRSRLRETIKQSDCPDKQLFLSYLERQPRKKTKK